MLKRLYCAIIATAQLVMDVIHTCVATSLKVLSHDENGQNLFRSSLAISAISAHANEDTPVVRDD